ncbi:MAG: GNAT family N-acetyltransferase [Ignavibacteriae bacterium]|nr:GNAT family N-acetyltransferase [Ignavibacteriota bacterium]
MPTTDLIRSVRRFNRFYTDQIGLLNQHVLDSPFSLVEVRVLYEIFHAGECTSVHLQSLLRIDPGYLSRILTSYQTRGLIRKRPSPNDGRSQLITLSSKGKKVFEELDQRSDALIESLTGKLAGSGKELLLQSMMNIEHLLSPADKRALASEITIRTELRPGDLGYVTYLHGVLYKEEYDYDIAFESYVAAGLDEFYRSYDPAKNRVWVCERGRHIVGFLLLMNRGAAAQLRYFLLRPEYRGIGLGTKLMDLYMAFFHQCDYKTSYLWTTSELITAAHLYRKYGFMLAEEKKSTAFGKPVTEQRYDLRLKS